MTAPPSAPVKRHHWIVRLTHWMTFVLLAGMIMSGLQIYGAYARFGERDGPYYAPNPFQDHGFPKWSRLGGWLAGGLNWHFTLMWPLTLGGFLYLSYLAASGEWRSVPFWALGISGGAVMALLGGMDFHGLSHRPRVAGVHRGSGVTARHDLRVVSRPIPQS